jgi:hypothetical protein
MPVHSPVRWVMLTFYLGVKRPEREVDCSPQFGDPLECVELYLHSPIRVRDVDLKHMNNLIFTSCQDGTETMKDCQN